ncbi:hypothetical protein AVEN_51496-1 [Araneus ventricosus]|uniref:Uncharacterized protein n=1 Tax=Araneus ventricosus TaxID=182803 RepID=A0A4Y2TYZ6_ARAVE|nr:hypothetical protein AVEN_51496-1 [Araneus ventricosus]
MYKPTYIQLRCIDFIQNFIQIYNSNDKTIRIRVRFCISVFASTWTDRKLSIHRFPPNVVDIYIFGVKITYRISSAYLSALLGHRVHIHAEDREAESSLTDFLQILWISTILE